MAFVSHGRNPDKSSSLHQQHHKLYRKLVRKMRIFVGILATLSNSSRRWQGLPPKSNPNSMQFAARQESSSTESARSILASVSSNTALSVFLNSREMQPVKKLNAVNETAFTGKGRTRIFGTQHSKELMEPDKRQSS